MKKERKRERVENFSQGKEMRRLICLINVVGAFYRSFVASVSFLPYFPAVVSAAPLKS